MGLQDKLRLQGSPLSKANGADPAISKGATDQSKLHYTYSIDGDPTIRRIVPSPSGLDLNGQKPSNSYDNTAPTEGLGNI